mgnify:CR=1 FL=1
MGFLFEPFQIANQPRRKSDGFICPPALAYRLLGVFRLMLAMLFGMPELCWGRVDNAPLQELAIRDGCAHSGIAEQALPGALL